MKRKGESVRNRQLLALGTAGVLALGIAACGGSDSSSSTSESSSSGLGGAPGGSINGAGATFPEPVYSEAGSQIKGEGLTVNYNGVGSGEGQAQLLAGTVDWAGSDPPLEPSFYDQIAKKFGTPAVHIPSVFGAVTVSYNVSGIDPGLKLDGATIADIFLGNITKWNDPAIAKQNPDLQLPDSDITVVHRSEDSGTTKLFTTFLSDYSPDWKKDVGADSTVKWPTGTGAKGNDGVAGAIKQTEGSIGYVEQAYALQNDFATADVKNSEGNYVAPSLDSTAAAGESADFGSASDLAKNGLFTINGSGSATYPIASASHILVYQDMCKAGLSEDDAKNVVAWVNFILGPGQDIAQKLSYAPLPDNVLNADQENVSGLECDGKPIDVSG
jgi:phosphate transport system substrate-binding protein